MTVRRDERRLKLRLRQTLGASRLTRLATTTTVDNELHVGSHGRNSLEVAAGSAYAPGSSLRRFCLNHVGAGNAVKFGDSGAAVTGYESPTPKIFGVNSHPNGEGGRVGLPRNTSG